MAQRSARNRDLTPNRTLCLVSSDPEEEYDYDYDYDKDGCEPWENGDCHSLAVPAFRGTEIEERRTCAVLRES